MDRRESGEDRREFEEFLSRPLPIPASEDNVFDGDEHKGSDNHSEILKVSVGIGHKQTSEN